MESRSRASRPSSLSKAPGTFYLVDGIAAAEGGQGAGCDLLRGVEPNKRAVISAAPGARRNDTLAGEGAGREKDRHALPLLRRLLDRLRKGV
jgi:hypothetical protein